MTKPKERNFLVKDSFGILIRGYDVISVLLLVSFEKYRRFRGQRNLVLIDCLFDNTSGWWDIVPLSKLAIVCKL